jgi:hypothetical protein
MIREQHRRSENFWCNTNLTNVLILISKKWFEPLRKQFPIAFIVIVVAVKSPVVYSSVKVARQLYHNRGERQRPTMRGPPCNPG